MNPSSDTDLIERFREATKHLSPNRIAKDTRLSLPTAKRLKKKPPARLSTDVRLLIMEYLEGGSNEGVEKGHVPRGTGSPGLTLRVLKRIYDVALGEGWTKEERAEVDRIRELVLSASGQQDATGLSTEEKIRMEAEDNDRKDRGRRVDLGDRTEPKNRTRRHPKPVQGNLGG